MSFVKPNVSALDPKEDDGTLYSRWLLYEFKKREIQKNTPMNNFIKNSIGIHYNPIGREYAAKILKKYMWIDSTNVIVTTFRLQDTSITETNIIIYAFLYSILKTTKKNKGNPELVHIYFCTGPSLLSRDGEYRQRLIKYNTLQIVAERHANLWKRIEEYIVRKNIFLPWNYYTESFFPVEQKASISAMLENDIIKKRLPIKFLTASWFTELYNIVNKIPVNHVNQLYLSIIGLSGEKTLVHDKQFYIKLTKEFGKNEIYTLRRDLNVYSISPGSDSSSLKIGQKLIPLNISEAQNPFNIKYKPWREFLIAEKVQNLIINGISKGYPFIGDYFYIKEVRKTIFDNYVQYMRLEHSEQAINITKKLLEARRATFYAEDPHGSRTKRRRKKKNDKESKIFVTATGEKIKKKHKTESPTQKDSMNRTLGDSFENILSWLSEKFRLLYEKIDDPIEYSKRELIMSEVAFGFISEYVGRSFYDFLLINDEKTGSKKYIEKTGNALKNYEIWAKYIFEYIYSLLCLNLHMGLIHGDLHLNNATIHSMFYKENINTDRHEKRQKIPYSLYVLKPHDESKEEVVFGFKTKQYHSCIIDHSRSIIKPSMIYMYEDFNIVEAKKMKLYDDGPIQFLGKEEENEFYKEQVKRISLMIENSFPDLYVENKDGICIALSNYLEELFPILTVIDIYRFTTEIIKFFKIKKIMENSKQLKLIKKINSKAESYFTKTFLDVVKNPELLKEKEYKVFPNWIILNEFFSDFIIMTSHNDSWKQSAFHESVVDDAAHVIDVSFLHNKMKYSLDKYSEFPDFLKCTKLMYKDGQIKYWKEKLHDPSKSLRMKIEKGKKKNLETLSLIASRHIFKYA